MLMTTNVERSTSFLSVDGYAEDTAEQNLIVRICKSGAEVTDNKCVSKTNIRHTGGQSNSELFASLFSKATYKASNVTILKTELSVDWVDPRVGLAWVKYDKSILYFLMITQHTIAYQLSCSTVVEQFT